MDDMTDPSLSTTITDVQRDRAVEYLQRVYASGELSEELFEQRLGMALTAQTRAELNASLHGLARVAGMFPAPPAAKHPVHDGLQNLVAGFFHLATLPTMFLVPAIGRGLASHVLSVQCSDLRGHRHHPRGFKSGPIGVLALWLRRLESDDTLAGHPLSVWGEVDCSHRTVHAHAAS